MVNEVCLLLANEFGNGYFTDSIIIQSLILLVQFTDVPILSCKSSFSDFFLGWCVFSLPVLL